MGIRLQVEDDGEAAAVKAAAILATALTAAPPGPLSLALSGGSTPAPMFRALAARDDLRWGELGIWQVDERLGATAGDLNASAIEDSGLAARASAFHAMDVLAPDPGEAARTYAASLPVRFTAMHLGLGDDGHTASLVPGDPVAQLRSADVAVSDTYRGFRRLTLTAPVIESALLVVFLVIGASKREALSRLIAGDASIPAGALTLADAVVVADRDAAGA